MLFEFLFSWIHIFCNVTIRSRDKQNAFNVGRKLGNVGNNIDIAWWPETLELFSMCLDTTLTGSTQSCEVKWHPLVVGRLTRGTFSELVNLGYWKTKDYTSYSLSCTHVNVSWDHSLFEIWIDFYARFRHKYSVCLISFLWLYK